MVNAIQPAFMQKTAFTLQGSATGKARKSAVSQYKSVNIINKSV